MSGFAVLYRRHGASASGADLAPMMQALVHRGPHGSRSWSQGHVALGHLHFWTAPEDRAEGQPLVAEGGKLAIVFDGRLDNCEELASLLAHEHGPLLGDAGLVLLAYRRWGMACFQRLLGSFALVIADFTTDTLVCARDVTGERSLFYHVGQNCVAVASEEAALLALPSVSRDLDEITLAHYLALRVPPAGHTFFQAIRELPPAHRAVVGPDHIEEQRYWAPDALSLPTYRTDQEYADRFREILTVSVHCRMRADAPVAVMMSGGLDSTAVAAVAARELAQTGERLRTVSAVFPGLPSCDETPFIAEMVRHYQLDSTLVPCTDAFPLSPAETRPHDPGRPDADPHRLMEQRLYRAAAGAGARVLLSGMFGDDLYRGAEMWLADLLAEGRVMEAAQQVVEQARRIGAGAVVTSASMRQVVKHLLGRQGRGNAEPNLPWLTERAGRLVAAAMPPAQWPVRRPEQGRVLLAGMAVSDAERERRFAAKCGIELRHPYRDRRLIAFMLAVPAHQLYNHGQWKYVLRMAMRDLLPEKVVGRPKQATLGELFQRGVSSQGLARQVLSHPQAAWPFYVRPEWLWPALERMGKPAALAGDEAEASVIWRCISLELWLRPEALSESSRDINKE